LTNGTIFSGIPRLAVMPRCAWFRVCQLGL